MLSVVVFIAINKVLSSIITTATVKYDMQAIKTKSAMFNSREGKIGRRVSEIKETSFR